MGKDPRSWRRNRSSTIRRGETQRSEFGAMLRRSTLNFGPPCRSELDDASMTFEDCALQRILSMDTPALAVGKEPQDLSSRSATRPNRLEATDAPIEPPPEPLAERTEEFSNRGLQAPPIDQIGVAAPDAIFVSDREIRIGKDDRVNVLSAPPSRPKQHRTAIITGMLLLSHESAPMDRPARRPESEAHAPTGPRTCGNRSALRGVRGCSGHRTRSSR